MPDTENTADLHRANAELRERVAFLENALSEKERIVANCQLTDERECYLSAILETTQDGFLALDADMKIVDANEAYCRMSGFTKAELLKMHMYDLEAVETVQEIQTRLRRLIANRTECFETRHRRKDKSIFDVEVSVTCPNRNQDNWKFVGFCRDISERKRAEQVIRESELLYRSILKASPDIITITDLEGRVRVASPSGLKIFGYKREEDVLGCSITDFLIAEDRERARHNISLMFQGIFTGIGEYRGVRPDGTGFLIETNGEFVRDQAGKPVGMIFITRDITERKRAELALMQSAQNYREIFNATNEAVFIADVNKTCLIDANDAMVRMTGYDSKDELLASDVWALIENGPPYTRQEAMHLIRKTLEGGLQVVDWIGRKKNGESRWIEVSLHSTKIGGEGRILGVIRDITERKLAEIERERLMTAIEQTGETIVITDPRAIIQYVNPAFERITGYSRNEAIGRNPRMLKSGQHDKAFYASMWQTLAAGQTWEGRLINKRKDGAFYTEVAVISPVRDASGAIVNYVCIKRDITRELEIEHELLQAQKMESVGRLAGGVAHDFNNMLMAIVGYVELCRYELPPDHSVHKWLDEINNSAERSANLTQQLLAFARKQLIVPKVLDLNDTIARILKLLRRLIGEHITLLWMPGAKLWPVKLDPSQVDQILTNLCINARDAIGNTGTVTIETKDVTFDESTCPSLPEKIAPGAYVLLTVSDNGCGMEKDVLDRIFDPFFTTKEVGKGTGLGLATVYGIVRQNNGHISVQSEPGKGTTFTIYLPSVSENHFETAEKHATGTPRGKGETVLVVEDEDALRKTCGLLLEGLGYTVLLADTPTDAQNIVFSHADDIHLLLTDVIMPEINGKQLAKRLCEIRPNLKVLFMSGYQASMLAQDGILDEGVNFIGKPFTRDELARMVRKILDAA